MDSDPRSAGRLALDALTHVSQLVQSEVAVARAESSEKISEAIAGATMLVVAGLLLIPVMVVLLIAIGAWLIELGLRPSLAYGAAAFAGFVLVGGLALFGKSKLSPSNLRPNHTLFEIARTVRAAKRVK